MTSLQALEATILASVGVISLMLAITAGAKALHALRRYWYASYQRRLEPALERYVMTGERQAEFYDLGLRRRDRFLCALLVQRSALLKGAGRESIARLADDLGLVGFYLRRLTSRRRKERARAAENLGYFGGPHAARSLSMLLTDRDETVRAVAARALARIGTDEAVRALVHTLDAPSELTRLRVAENLERIGSRAVASLVDVLVREAETAGTAGSQGAIMAAGVLGNLRAASARNVLLRTLALHESDELRSEAARALGLIGDPDDVPVLLDASRDEVWSVRAQAAHALGTIGETSATARLGEMVSDEVWWVRRSATAALANMGPGGEETLVDLLRCGLRGVREQVTATLEARGIIARSVSSLGKPGRRGERAHRLTTALVAAGMTRHLEEFARRLPESEGRRLLLEALEGDVPPGLEGSRDGANGTAARSDGEGSA